MGVKVNYSPSALHDLNSIYDYISVELSNVNAADLLINEIIKAIDRLEEFPLSGNTLSSIVDLKTDYYFLVVKNYLVFYRFLNNVVYIDRVLYSKREYLKILFGIK
ncbi:type II toxin-antitoxin system RelE/ParE family toxin [Anaerovibrio slackiae]|uniref:type II toxin-antitoxin system RelE/ParE family toxin n=1 Tax=Anaerovibrio slackiae TaxID=2652309 RepID=UPI00386553D7